MLKEAARLGYISENPSRGVGAVKETPKEKSFLTLDEVRKLFQEDSIKAIWEDKLDHFTINLIAASTGMRMGEIQGLQVQYVNPNHIVVTNSWGRKHGLKEPKFRSNRTIPIPTRTSEYLHIAADQSPYKEPDDLVFYGSNRKKPIDHKKIGEIFYQAINRIGINEEQRKKRNITFHSWRHFFNTHCRLNKIPDSKIQRITGHKTQEMTEHYTQFQIDDYKDVIQLQGEILGQ